jgi:hypothetical protein
LVMESHGDYSDVFGAYDKVPAPSDEMLALQRQRRLEFLANSNLRRHTIHLYTGLRTGFSQRAFRKFTEAEHRKRVGRLRDLSDKVCSVLQTAGIGSTLLGEQQILEQFYKQLNPDKKHQPHFARRPELLPEAMRKANRNLRALTVREYLMQTDMQWHADCLRIGNQYYQVLTLRDLPERTQFADVELYYDLDFDFRLSVTLEIPSQQRHKSALNQQRRIARADQGRGGNIEDYTRTERVREGEELASLLAETKQRLVLSTAQAAISAPSRRELHKRVRRFEEAAAAGGYTYFAEFGAHDREFFKTLPGMSTVAERQLLMTSENGVDLLPVFEEDRGDKEPVMLVKTDRGELFSFNPFSSVRDNQNATIFGASGSGKSVFCNLLIATSILANISRGKLIVVDFAGENKSSYLMLSKLFGGVFIPILGESTQFAINPFPPASKALDADASLRPETETFLSVLTDLLLHNSGRGKDEQLYRNLIKQGIRDTYQRLGDQTPIYSDLLDTLRRYQGRDEVDQARLETVIKLLDGFLSSSSAKLFNRQSEANPDVPFLILDLFGIDTLEPHIAQAITFVTCNWVKQIVFDPTNTGYKYAILDEVAQLIRQPEMVALLEELYSTSRKHRGAVWTITQQYSTYRESVLASTIKLNSTTQIFLSHASDEQGRQLIAEDYAFSRREKNLFDGLKTLKGQYSSALIRTEVADRIGDEKHYLSSVLRIELSPYDYEICTSDSADRELQRRIYQANPNRPLHEVLEFVAEYKRRKKGRVA